MKHQSKTIRAQAAKDFSMSRLDQHHQAEGVSLSGSAGKTSPARNPRSGQTLIFMAMVVLMIAFAALFYFDLNKVLHVKAMSRNSGDAAALAGARWQAISLNLVGSLNTAQAAALTDALSNGTASSPESDVIAELQRRIQFSGPIFGVVAAQQVAKQNGLHNQPMFASSVQSHVDLIRDEYNLFYPQPFQPSSGYQSAWDEVADMYSLIANQGMAVQPAWQYYATYTNTNHLLLNPSFYDAIAGQSWCWFYWNAYEELLSYSNYTDWEELPEISIDPPVNSEVLSLHLRRIRVRDSVPVLPPGNEWRDLMDELQAALIQMAVNEPTLYDEVNVQWCYYSPSRWSSWQSFIPEGFPWDRDIKEEYDYGGADSAMMVLAGVNRHSDMKYWNEGEQANEYPVDWSAVGKPFGTLGGDEGPIPPNSLGVVLPAYTDVRLIPIDASMSGSNDQLRPGWLDFIMHILPHYVQHGPSVLPPGNWYANQLLKWEVAQFRQTGIDYLQDYSENCQQCGPPGGSSSGGTRYGR